MKGKLSERHLDFFNVSVSVRAGQQLPSHAEKADIRYNKFLLYSLRTSVRGQTSILGYLGHYKSRRSHEIIYNFIS